MARSAGQFFSGESREGGGNYSEAEGWPTYNFFNAILSAITSFQSHGVQAWDVYDDLDTYDKILHSVGDRSLGGAGLKGDTDIFLRLRATSTGYIYIRLYYDWSTVSHTGNVATTERNFLFERYSSVRWWMIVNEYEIALFAKEDGSNVVWIGQPIQHDYHQDGIARLSVATSGTGVQTLTLDRDLTGKIRAGQKLWLMNRTPDGQALKTANVNIVTVVAVGSSSVTVSGITSTPFEIGSLIGWAPRCAMFTVSSDVGYGPVRSDGTPISTTYDLEVLTGSKVTQTITETRPGCTGAWYMWPVSVCCLVGGYDRPMGRAQFLFGVPRDALGLGVVIYKDCDPDQKFLCFPRAGIVDAEMYCAIGPISEA